MYVLGTNGGLTIDLRRTGHRLFVELLKGHLSHVRLGHFKLQMFERPFHPSRHAGGVVVRSSCLHRRRVELYRSRKKGSLKHRTEHSSAQLQVASGNLSTETTYALQVQARSPWEVVQPEKTAGSTDAPHGLGYNSLFYVSFLSPSRFCQCFVV